MPPLATSEATGLAVLGGSFSIAYHGEPGDRLSVLLSGTPGLAPPPGKGGFPLLVGRGSFFFVLALGALDATGTKVLSLSVPDIADLHGTAALFQGVVSSPAGAHDPQLTNLSCVIVKEP